MRLLEIENLRVSINGAPIVRIDELSVARGQRLAIVGESGSGKSLSVLSLLGLQTQDATVTGSVRLDGVELVGRADRNMRKVRGSLVGTVFQDALRSLNPTMKVGRQVTETLRLHQGIGRREAHREAVSALDRVGLPDPELLAHRYSHQLSGGQRQRVLIAVAIACRPQLLIADEPTTALDVTVQEEILNLILSLSEAEDMSVLLVSHDLGVVRALCNDVAVMYGGRIVEQGPASEVIGHSRNRYTHALVQANPGIEAGDGHGGHRKLATIPGTVPAAGQFPQGCPFRGRCDGALDVCSDWPIAEVARSTGSHSPHLYHCWNPTNVAGHRDSDGARS